MNFNEYQQEAAKTAIYPGANTTTGLVYTALGLSNEAGEVTGAIKKVLRDDAGVVTEKKKDQIKAELSDVCWYLAMIAYELQIPLEEIFEYNVDKLRGRAERGTLGGNGDDR